MKHAPATLALALALAAAGAAGAQSAPGLFAAPPTDAKAMSLMLPLGAPAAFTDAQAEALRTGVARTSVDRRLSDRLTSSIGFLCGLHPSVGHQGAAAMRGDDPQGRFLGAKLSLSFH